MVIMNVDMEEYNAHQPKATSSPFCPLAKL
jgi:hypothetical protein